MRIGCDTGFFKGLLEAHPVVTAVWQEAEAGEHELVVNCLTLFELQRLGLRGALPKDRIEILLEHLPQSCRIVWLDAEHAPLLARAARLAHGNGLAMADALILTSLMAVDVDMIYTTDGDFEAYTTGPRIVKI